MRWPRVTKSVAASATCLLLLFAAPTGAQTDADPALVAEIETIKAIDNHAHPIRALSEGEEDREFDALIPDELEPAPLPLKLRPDDMSEAHLRELVEAKNRTRREKGDDYPAWVLDRLGIETMLGNRVAMGRGVAAPGFRWVTYVRNTMIVSTPTDTIRDALPVL